MSRVAVVQLRASVHKDENLKAAISYIKEAKSKKADLVAIRGYTDDIRSGYAWRLDTQIRIVRKLLLVTTVTLRNCSSCFR